MARLPTYPIQQCPQCGANLKRHKATYYDCPSCGAHCKLTDEGMVVVKKRFIVRRKLVSDTSGKYLDADESERLNGWLGWDE